MNTWRRGRALILENSPDQDLDLKAFVEDVTGKSYPRVAGTAIYLVATPNRVPQALASNLRHNKVLHERNIVLHLVFVEESWVGMDKRTTLQPRSEEHTSELQSLMRISYAVFCLKKKKKKTQRKQDKKTKE